MRKSYSTYLKFFLGWPLSLLALYFIIETFSPNIASLSEKIETLRLIPLAVGVFLFLIFFLVRNLVWHKILHYMGNTFLFSDTSYLWSFSQLKRYIPGNIWALVGLSVAFSGKNMQKKDIAYAILVETQIVVLATLLVSLLSLPFIFTNIFSTNNSQPLQYAIVILCSLSAIIYIFYSRLSKKIKFKYMDFLSRFLPKFSPGQTFVLLLLMTFGYLCFGLGYYFVTVSLTFLSPGLIWSLTGYFVLSLLIGFLSIITPSGLGVREGAITLGLDKILPVGLAAFASIFSRIVLIFSELLYLFLSYILYKIKKSYSQKIEVFFSKNIYGILLSAGTGIFIFYFSYISILRYGNFFTGRFDLGNMSQTIWNTTQGRIFEMNDPNGLVILSRLAFHADFILVLLSPFYFLWSDPRILLILQALVVGSGAFFVYQLAKYFLKNKLLALLFGMSYLFNPSVQWSILYDFHAVTFATTFLLGAFYFISKKRYIWFVIFALLAALTKEQIWFILALFGFYVITQRTFALFKAREIKQFVTDKTILFGGTVSVVSLAVFYYLIWHAIPNAAGGTDHFALSYYEGSGDSPTEFIKSLIFSPGNTLRLLFQTDRINYVLQLLLPVGFLPLLAPMYLIFAFPDFLLNILSTKVEPHQIYYQYTAAITPFLFISSIFASSLLLRKFERKAFAALITLIPLSAFIGSYFYSPLPGMKMENIAVFTHPQINKDLINKALQIIPNDAKVAATNNLGAQLANRQSLYVLPAGWENAGYIAFLFKNDSWKATQELVDLAENLKRNKGFDLVADNNGFLLFRKIADE